MSKIELPPEPEPTAYCYRTTCVPSGAPLWATKEAHDSGVLKTQALFTADQLRARERQIAEVCAKAAERATHRQRQAAAWANCEPIKPCPAAAAIRNLIEESNNG